MESTRHIASQRAAAGLRADPVSAVSLQVPLQPGAHKERNRFGIFIKRFSFRWSL